jgi:hypothetical protein
MWWGVILLLFPAVVLGFLLQAVIEAFAFGRVLLQWLRDDA